MHAVSILSNERYAEQSPSLSLLARLHQRVR